MMPLSDYVAARAGTRHWVVAPRLTARLKEKGFEKAISQKRFAELKAECEMQGKPILLGQESAQ